MGNQEEQCGTPRLVTRGGTASAHELKEKLLKLPVLCRGPGQELRPGAEGLSHLQRPSEPAGRELGNMYPSFPPLTFLPCLGSAKSKLKSQKTPTHTDP